MKLQPLTSSCVEQSGHKKSVKIVVLIVLRANYWRGVGSWWLDEPKAKIYSYSYYWKNTQQTCMITMRENN